MLKRSLREDLNEFIDVVEIAVDLMKDALDNIMQAVISLKDMKDVELSSYEDILTGLKKRVAGALDVLDSAADELYNLFDYVPGEEPVVPEEEKELPEEELPEEEFEEEDYLEGELPEEEFEEEESPEEEL